MHPLVLAPAPIISTIYTPSKSRILPLRKMSLITTLAWQRRNSLPTRRVW
ncbi:hypothetical protein CaCOL14_009413 [Colletotrichum acutatum]